MNKGILRNLTYVLMGIVLSKLLGAIYRILLVRVLGGVGIGFYQMVFPIYSLVVVIVSAGVPLAVSKLVANKSTEEEKTNVVVNTFYLSFFLSIILILMMFGLSKTIAILQGEKRLATCYLLLAPSIIFTALSAVIKGYFQGEEIFKYSALSQLIEQMAKLLIGLVLAYLFAKKSIYASINGALIGITASELISFLYLLFKWKNLVKKAVIKFDKNVAKEILSIALPITISSIIIPFSSFVDSFIVVNLLNNKTPPMVSTFMFGLQSGVVGTLINLPTMVVFALASILLPQFTKLYKDGNNNLLKKKIGYAIKISLLILVPVALFFIISPHEIIKLLYGDKLYFNGVNGFDISSNLVVLNSLTIVFIGMSQLFSIILQSIENRYAPIKNILIGVGCKFLIELIFLPSNLSIYTLAFSNGACYLTSMSLNLSEILKQLDLKMDFKFLYKFSVSLSAFLLMFCTFMLLNKNSGSFLTITIISFAFYLEMLIATKLINKKDINFYLKS